MKQPGQIPPASHHATYSFRRLGQQQQRTSSATPHLSLRRQSIVTNCSDGRVVSRPKSNAEKARILSRILQEALDLIDDDLDFDVRKP